MRRIFLNRKINDKEKGGNGRRRGKSDLGNEVYLMLVKTGLIKREYRAIGAHRWLNDK